MVRGGACIPGSPSGTDCRSRTNPESKRSLDRNGFWNYNSRCYCIYRVSRKRVNFMSQATPPSGKNIPTRTRHTFFAARYNRNSSSKMERDLMRPLRREMVGKAYGVVIEIGAGTGLNFEFYEPGQVEHVEATDLDSAMLDYARENRQSARVPITVTQAPAEMLPFADATFDCAVSTLVFCSVSDQMQGLAEIKRVLKPGGTLLMIEHVRSKRRIVAGLQDIVTPITKRILGNCHWNRDTVRNIIDAGFKMTELRNLKRTTLPMVLVEARSM